MKEDKLGDLSMELSVRSTRKRYQCFSLQTVLIMKKFIIIATILQMIMLGDMEL